jgi:hypothetical protein
VVEDPRKSRTQQKVLTKNGPPHFLYNGDFGEKTMSPNVEEKALVALGSGEPSGLETLFQDGCGASVSV